MNSKSKFVICNKQKDCVEIREVMRVLLRAYAFHLSSAPHTAHKFLMSHLGLDGSLWIPGTYYEYLQYIIHPSICFMFLF